MKFALKTLIAIVHIGIVAVGVSMSLKASIGVGAWDALTQTLALILNLQIGTFVMILNSSLVLVQWALLRSRFDAKRLIQIPVVIVLGSVVNFVFYTLFADLVLPSYLFQVMFYLSGVLIIAYGVGLIMALNVITFPLESLCLVISEITGLSFGRIRQGVDVISIVIVLALSFGLSLPLAIREGTLMGILLFGFLVGWFYKTFKSTFERLNLIDA